MRKTWNHNFFYKISTKTPETRENKNGYPFQIKSSFKLFKVILIVGKHKN